MMFVMVVIVTMIMPVSVSENYQNQSEHGYGLCSIENYSILLFSFVHMVMMDMLFT